MFTDGNGNPVIISEFRDNPKKYYLDQKGRAFKIESKKVGNTEVREIVYIHAGGSFSSNPPVLTSQKEAWNLPTAERSELLDEGYRLWKYDPLGGIIVYLTTCFILGRGVKFQFDDPVAQFHSNKFYKKNKLETKLRSASDELTAYGEIFVWLRPKNEDIIYNGKALWRKGDVQVTFIPPSNITSIATAEEDVGDVYEYTYQWMDAQGNPQSRNIPDITKFDFENSDPETGCIYHIAINKGNNDAFGQSDLIRIKEWLDNYQDYLRDGVIINKLYRSPAFDISIEDGTPEEIEEAKARYNGWTIGSNPIHNSREKWDILEFNGPNVSSENARRALLLIIAAGVGFPEYMLADGSNSNLASTKSQELPVIKKFEDRQDLFSEFIKNILNFNLFCKYYYGVGTGLSVTKDRDGDFEEFVATIEFPPIVRDDDLNTSRTNTEALKGGYISLSTAAARLGIDFQREVELMLSEKQLLDKLEQAGIQVVIKSDEVQGKGESTGLPSQQNQNQSRPAQPAANS